MLRGYRRIILAAVGWLILCGANPPAKQADSRDSTKKAAPTSQLAPPPAPSPAAGDSGKFSAYPGYNPDPCYNAQDHDAADLCAQWRAAMAAEKAASEAERATTWAAIATFLSVATVIGLIVSLWQTWGALGEARRGNILAMRENARNSVRAISSAKETSKVIDATKEASEIAREQMNIENRAWITANPAITKNIKFADGVMSLPLELEITNIGRTTAKHCFISTEIFITDGRGDQPNRLDEICHLHIYNKEKLRGYNIMPREKFIQQKTLKLDMETAKGTFLYEDHGIIMVGLVISIKYMTDMDSRNHHTGIGFWVFPTDPTIPNVFNPLGGEVDASRISFQRFEGGLAT